MSLVRKMFFSLPEPKVIYFFVLDMIFLEIWGWRPDFGAGINREINWSF